MNSFISSINNQQNYMRTENGALAHKSTNSALYDLFAFGGAIVIDLMKMLSLFLVMH